MIQDFITTYCPIFKRYVTPYTVDSIVHVKIQVTSVTNLNEMVNRDQSDERIIAIMSDIASFDI